MQQRTVQKRWSSQAGMSMIEMLIAVVILAVGLLGLAQMQVSAMRANSQSNVTATVAAVAQRVIESVVAMSPDNAVFNNGFTNAAWPGGSSITLPGSGTLNVTYSVRRSIDPDDPDPNGPGYLGVQNLCRVDVRVTTASNVPWSYGISKQHSVTMTTLKRAS